MKIDQIHDFQTLHGANMQVFEDHVLKFLEINIAVVGEMCMTSKMHGFSHVIDDLKKFKCQLYALSTYCFETALQDYHTMLRSGHKPLEQIRYLINIGDYKHTCLHTT